MSEASTTDTPPPFVPPVTPVLGTFTEVTPEDLKAQARNQAMLDAGNQQSEDPPRQTAASRMKQKVRDVLDAQPFHAEHIHKSDLLAVIDALIDGPDSYGPGY